MLYLNAAFYDFLVQYFLPSVSRTNRLRMQTNQKKREKQEGEREGEIKRKTEEREGETGGREREKEGNNHETIVNEGNNRRPYSCCCCFWQIAA